MVLVRISCCNVVFVVDDDDDDDDDGDNDDDKLFSRVKTSCFRAKAHLVFHWRLNKNIIKTMVMVRKTMIEIGKFS